MPQYLAKITDGVFELGAEETRHAVSVMRAKKGDIIKIFDGSGRKYEAALDAVAKTAAGRIIKELPVKKSKYNLTLCFAPTARTAVEDMLDQCTQAGVCAFRPVITKYTENDITKKWEQKKERWAQIVLAAAKQCETAFLPQIHDPVDFDYALNNFSPALLAYEKENALALPDALKSIPGGNLFIFIGPVGGFTQEEAAIAAQKGARAVTLGPNIMRAETAALAAAALTLI